MTYSDKLKDPRWQKKRLEIFERDGFKCTECEDEKNTLHVHHKNYYYGKAPWECNNNNLTTLCETCHLREEDWKLRTNDLIHDMLIMGWNYHRIYHEIEHSLFKEDVENWHKYLKTDHGKKIYGHK